MNDGETIYSAEETKVTQQATAMATRTAIKDFNTEELCEFLKSTGNISDEVIENFRTNLITGSTFIELDMDDLKELLPLVGDRKIVRKVILLYNPTSPEVSIYFLYNNQHY